MDNVPHVHLGDDLVYSSVYYIQNPDKEYGTAIEDETLVYGVENRCLFFDGSKIMHCGVCFTFRRSCRLPTIHNRNEL